MSEDDNFELSRRKILGAAGTVGAAGALGGAGTMALFNDTESSTGNAVTAGQLDLKLDWDMTYNGATTHTDSQKLTNNPGPIFELGVHNDVKPGDEGEATISVHVDDNPAYLWMGGELTANDDNGLTEPESDVDNTGGDGEGELADAIQVRVWYDEDGDNEFDRRADGKELEVALVSDTSGSMGGSKLTSLKSAAKGFVDQLVAPDEGAAVSFATSASVDQQLTTDYAAIKSAIDGYSAGGGTDIGAGVTKAEDELLNGTNATAGAAKVMVLLSDGLPQDEQKARNAANAAKGNGIRIITIALGSGADTALLEDLASSPSDAYTGTAADLDDIYQSIATSVITGEEVIASGSLSSVLGTLSSGVALDGDRSTDARDCYPANDTQYIGFEWWLPPSVGNVVQSDSVVFDLEFYAEQCRHNDNPDNPFA